VRRGGGLSLNPFGLWLGKSCLPRTLFRKMALVDENTPYWLALGRVDGLGVRGAHKLIEYFSSPQAVYHASRTELEGCGLPARVAQAIFAQSGLKEAEQEIDAAQKADCSLVIYGRGSYPRLLQEIADAPLVLYVLGDIDVLSQHAVAVVGTRRPTAYGSSVAHRLACDLAQRQLAIVSGLARGVDSAAHRGALEAKGKTIAVLGSGADVIYPRENKRLAEQVAEAGAVISEFPLGPLRPRRISPSATGLSAAWRLARWSLRRQNTAVR